MAEKKGQGGKKQRKPRKPSKLYSHYKVSGGALSARPIFCPKCGKGVAMAQHKDRKTCGKCHYTEFSKK